MFSFLRESPNADGTQGPLSMRRIAALATLITAIGTAIFALVIIFSFISGNPNSAIDWKAFLPLFIPCGLFLIGTILLLFFTTWEDIKSIVTVAAGLKK
jgi:ABC-type polysaccharide/polyol phosphate export permease